MHKMMFKLNMWNVLVRLGFEGSWKISEEDMMLYERLVKEMGRGDARVVSGGSLWGESVVVKGRME